MIDNALNDLKLRLEFMYFIKQVDVFVYNNLTL